MTADVQRELAEALATHRLVTPRQCFCGEREPYDERDAGFHRPEWHVAHALTKLLPLIAYAEKRAAARALTDAADWLDQDPDEGGAPYIASDGSVLFPHRLDIAEVVTWASASLRDRAAGALGPSGAAEGAGR